MKAVHTSVSAHRHIGTSAHRHILVTLLSTFALSACVGSDTLTPPEPLNPQQTVEARASESIYGSPDVSAEAIGKIDSIARWLAFQLAEQPRRERLTSALRMSTADEEHKLYLGQAIASLQTGEIITEGFETPERAPGTPRSFADLDHEMEVYMPVRAQRDAYTGAAPLLVAWQVFEDSAPIAYEPDGRRRVLSLDGPPAQPVLVVVPKEGTLNQILLKPDCRNSVEVTAGIGTWTCAQATMNVANAEAVRGEIASSCDPATAIIPCDDPPTNGSPPPAPGFYLTDAQLDNLHEPWALGSPEITYLVTTVPTFGDPDDTEISCLSDAPWPTPAHFLDHNSHSQSFAVGGTHMFLSLAAINDMEVIAAARGNSTADIKVTVWENDDGNKCNFDDTGGLADAVAAANAIHGLIGIAKGFGKCVNTTINPQDTILIQGSLRHFEISSTLCGLLRVAGLVTSALKVFLGGDDFIGVAETVPDPALNGGWTHVIGNSAGQQVGRFNITGVDAP